MMRETSSEGIAGTNCVRNFNAETFVLNHSILGNRMLPCAPGVMQISFNFRWKFWIAQQLVKLNFGHYNRGFDGAFSARSA